VTSSRHDGYLGPDLDVDTFWCCPTPYTIHFMYNRVARPRFRGDDYGTGDTRIRPHTILQIPAFC